MFLSLVLGDFGQFFVKKIVCFCRNRPIFFDESGNKIITLVPVSGT
jgi:hypothetical protein